VTARLALGTASALGLGRFAYGLILPAMTGELHWDLARAGTMTTANGLGYLVGALATATVARRAGLPATFRTGMVLCALALAATAATTNYPALFAARAVAGVGGALVFIAGAVMAPTAVFFAGTGVGIALSGAVVPVVLDGRPDRWPLAWAVLAVAAGVAAVVSWGATREPAAVAEDRRAPTGPLWTVVVAYLMFAAGYIAYITFLSAYLVDRHASTTQTALTWTLLGLAVVAGPALRRSMSLTLALGVIAAAALLALLAPAPPTVVLSAVAYGAVFMTVPATVTVLVRAGAPPGRVTGVLAAFTVVFAAGQMAGPWLAGLLADRAGPGASLVWTAALCGAASLVAAVGPGRRQVAPGRR
jgi:predicted MFS family arabinose efflux permease